MTKEWHNIVCLADDLGLEFLFQEDHIKFYKKDKELALLHKTSKNWVLLIGFPFGITKISKNPKKLVNLVATI